MAPQGGAVQQLAPDLWLLDTIFLGEPGVIASYLITGPDGLALVDVGSAVTVEQLLEGIRSTGFDPNELRHIVLTHIHLDHAGATGDLVRRFPAARVYVHGIGAPHLIDPSKLLVSAERIYGARMKVMWGDILPVPADRITTVDDGDVLAIGNRRLRALYTPGHAIHHVAFHDADHSAVFAGDVAGVRLAGSTFVRPPTPPPDINLEEWSASIDRLAELRPEVLYLPHFGPAGGVSEHLDQLRKRLYDWGELMLRGIRAGESDEMLAHDLAQYADPEVARETEGDTEASVRRYELATNYLMSAQGYVRYFKKHHPEKLT